MDRHKAVDSLLIVLGGTIVLAAVVLWWRSRGVEDIDLVQALSSSSSFNCGVECVCYLAAYSALEVKPTEVRRLGSKYFHDGAISLNELKKLCEEIGLGKAQAIEVKVDDLDYLTVPFIAHQTRPGVEHYVVCSKVSDNYVQLIDLLSSKSVIETIPKGVFEHRFTGYALVMTTR